MISYLGISILTCILQSTVSVDIKNAEYPACRLAKGIQDTGETMQRIVAIGDIHGEADGFKNILRSAGIIAENECVWVPQDGKGTLLIQVGDIVDRGPNALAAWECIKSLQAGAPEGSSVVRLVGNHELWWLNGQVHDRNKISDTKLVVTQIIHELRSSILEGTVQAAFNKAMHGINLLFVHAGFRQKFIDTILPVGFQGNEGKFLAQYANKALKRETAACEDANLNFCQIRGEIFDAGPERGGRSIGGPFWTDYSVIYEEQNALPSGYTVQIVGHTASRYHEIRSSHGLTSICVDAGMYFGGRSFFEIGSDGRFRVYKTTGGNDGPTDVFDLTEQTCTRSYEL